LAPGGPELPLVRPARGTGPAPPPRQPLPGRGGAALHPPAVRPPRGVLRGLRQRLPRGRRRDPPSRAERGPGGRLPDGRGRRARRALHRAHRAERRQRPEVDGVLAVDPYAPTPEERFTFGLWTVGNVGLDPFGRPTREPLDPTYVVAKLAELGAWGVNHHDSYLVPDGTPAHERDRIVARFRRALADNGLVVPMATTDLFRDPVFKDGAFTSADARVRNYALSKTMRAIDLGVELGAKTYVFWGGRDGAEVDAGGKLLDALAWYRDCLNYLCEYVVDQGYDLRFALEPKPNEPRGHAFRPAVGSALGFIATLERPEMVGLTPELAHETMAGLSYPHALAAAIDAGKLFHVDLNDQLMSRFDQDLRFGAENLK